MGLYDDPPAELACQRCIMFGQDLADLNLLYVKMASLSNLWFDKLAILDLEFFQMFDALLNLYPTFSNYFEKLANVITNKSILAVFGMNPEDVAGFQVSAISYTIFTPLNELYLPPIEVQDRKQKKSMVMMFSLINSLPMSTCYELGYKLASLVRL